MKLLARFCRGACTLYMGWCLSSARIWSADFNCECSTWTHQHAQAIQLQNSIM